MLKALNSNMRFLIICMISPLIFAIIRKIVPGQPVFLEVSGAVVVAVAALLIIYSGTVNFPSYLGNPLLFWVCLQVMYAVFSVFTDIRVGLAAIMTRVVPIAMAYISYGAIRDRMDLLRFSKVVCAMAIILFPLGVAGAIFDNEILPIWLRPIEKAFEEGQDIRLGVQVVSTIFSTGAVLSMSSLAIFYLSLANIVYAKQYSLKHKAIWFLSLVASLLLIYVSTRRGALLAALFGIAYYLIVINKFSVKRNLITLLLICINFIGILAIDYYTINERVSNESRMSLVVDSWVLMRRINEIFFGIFLRWLHETPFGTFLGFGGPEGPAFGVDPGASIEVGAAQLAAEMGFIGAVLFPIILVIIGYRLYRKSRRLPVNKTIVILLLFQLTYFVLYYTKELSNMTGVTIGQLFFWGAFGVSGALIRNEKQIIIREIN